VKTYWSENEIKEFIDRCQYVTLFNGELKAAGLKPRLMYNGGTTTLRCINTDYQREYYKFKKQYFVIMKKMIMDDQTVYRYYLYNDIVIAKKGSIYSFNKPDNISFDDINNNWQSALYFILN
jgi:hypothetical protein